MSRKFADHKTQIAKHRAETKIAESIILAKKGNTNYKSFANIQIALAILIHFNVICD